MTTAFYRAFEDAFRGSASLIKQRLQVYLPYLETYANRSPAAVGLDLGCGRGEWLSLLRELGIEPRGCDQDADMLAGLTEQGYDVTCRDLFAHLAETTDASIDILSAFHVVEHLTTAQLTDLLQQSQRVLKPGGMLILETPNPDNIQVGTHYFYLDPTHLTPIPSARLQFMVAFYGLKQTHTLGLQEPQHYPLAEIDSLSRVFSGVSPDYAVIGYQPDPGKADTESYQSEAGRSLNDVLTHYDTNQQTRYQVLEQQLQAQQTIVTAIQTQHDQLMQRNAQLQELNQALHDECQDIRKHLQMIFDSPCWTLCKPLRWLKRQCRQYWQQIRNR
ncbi:methylase involved in ubiquinone/menaquinone biosynthesis [Methylophaga frappieri]|uniref:Methylase involved in ubiquinone/menaquinone biosynthesis n=1 Tax=Methylophaga frappieri (strain ATCC BAA-2434 / DSM 25690 / JAM7) TaxID=754477 RepID=I1YKJ3_METFJ|nr:class I SAM-dependent methyltransferase [Methylophaga frappieri]AFJ03436.1 methylase involved in ubiquinone/menaquinone biosynthesis [Methylophaga frappieri]